MILFINQDYYGKTSFLAQCAMMVKRSLRLWHEMYHARIQRGGTESGPNPPPPLKNQNAIGLFSNYTGPDPLENHKVTNPAFNIRPLSVHHSNGVSLAGLWWYLDPLFPQLKKNVILKAEYACLHVKSRTKSNFTTLFYHRQYIYWTKVKTLHLNCLPSIYKIMQTKNANESVF